MPTLADPRPTAPRLSEAAGDGGEAIPLPATEVLARSAAAVDSGARWDGRARRPSVLAARIRSKSDGDCASESDSESCASSRSSASGSSRSSESPAKRRSPRQLWRHALRQVVAQHAASSRHRRGAETNGRAKMLWDYTLRRLSAHRSIVESDIEKYIAQSNVREYELFLQCQALRAEVLRLRAHREPRPPPAAEKRGSANPSHFCSRHCEACQLENEVITEVATAPLSAVKSPLQLTERKAQAVARLLIAASGEGPRGPHAVLDDVRAHFMRLPTSYALEVDPKDVPLHIAALAATVEPASPSSRPDSESPVAIEVCLAEEGAGRLRKNSEALVALAPPGRSSRRNSACGRRRSSTASDRCLQLPARPLKARRLQPPPPFRPTPAQVVASLRDGGQGTKALAAALAARRLELLDAVGYQTADTGYTLQTLLVSAAAGEDGVAPEPAAVAAALRISLAEALGAGGAGAQQRAGGSTHGGRDWIEQLFQGRERPAWWRNWYDEVAIVRKVAEGASGELYEGDWHGTRVAVKQFRHERGALQPRLWAEFVAEVETLSKLRHPNVVQFLGAGTSRGALWIVTEFLPGGTLGERIHDAKAALPRDEAVRLARETAAALAYLHASGLLHRDLKPSNVMLDGSGAARVVDMGLCCLKDDSGHAQGDAGTLRWTAPEILRGERYDEKVDVYSFGVLLWELFHRQVPFGSTPALLAAARAAQYGERPRVDPQLCTPEVAALVQECWAPSPRERPPFAAVLSRLSAMGDRTLPLPPPAPSSPGLPPAAPSRLPPADALGPPAPPAPCGTLASLFACLAPSTSRGS